MKWLSDRAKGMSASLTEMVGHRPRIDGACGTLYGAICANYSTYNPDWITYVAAFEADTPNLATCVPETSGTTKVLFDIVDLSNYVCPFWLVGLEKRNFYQ